MNLPNGAFMWSIEATKCRLGRDASWPKALWVFSPRNISPSILWIIMYTWRSGPVRTQELETSLIQTLNKKKTKKTSKLQCKDWLSLRVLLMNRIWSDGVRKLPSCSRTSHVREFKIWNKSNPLESPTVPSLIWSQTKNVVLHTDWFKCDGGKESIDHQVDVLSQVRHPEVLQQSLLAAQTIDHHTKSQPATHRDTLAFPQTASSVISRKKEREAKTSRTKLTVTATSTC